MILLLNRQHVTTWWFKKYYEFIFSNFSNELLNLYIYSALKRSRSWSPKNSLIIFIKKNTVLTKLNLFKIIKTVIWFIIEFKFTFKNNYIFCIIWNKFGNGWKYVCHSCSSWKYYSRQWSKLSNSWLWGW